MKKIQIYCDGGVKNILRQTHWVCGQTVVMLESVKGFCQTQICLEHIGVSLQGLLLYSVPLTLSWALDSMHTLGQTQREQFSASLSQAVA